MKRWRPYSIVTILGLAIALLLSLSPRFPVQAQLNQPNLFQSRPSQTELRGVWLTNIDSRVLFSQQELHHGIQRLAQLNLNTLYPSVWNWGYTLYPSDTLAQAIGESIDPHPALQGRDLLEEAIAEGHRLGLSVIPWFEFGLLSPSYSELARQHPDWITAQQDGTTVVMQGRHPRKWLNPFKPEVQDLLLGMIREVVTRYDVDGIQLDDHFGMPVELGYDDYTIAKYREEHDGDDPPSDAKDPEWMRWRANQITTLMGQIVQTVKTIKPDCMVSLSPNPHPFAYEYFLQDWATWVENGWLDELIVQVYRNGVESFVNVLEQPDVRDMKEKLPISIGILTGLKNRPTNFDLIETQVNATRDRQFSGVSFFFYESLGDRDDQFQSLFPEAAQRP
ncbi:MAG: family 10 glycosylhydrolase [Cyanobacteria bacterium P01_E01_bin.6]